MFPVGKDLGICVKVDNSFGVVTPRDNHLVCCTCKPDSCCHTRKLEELLESDREGCHTFETGRFSKAAFAKNRNYVCHSYSKISLDAVGLQAVISTPHIYRFGLEHGRFGIKSHETVCFQCHVKLEEQQEEAIMILPNQITYKAQVKFPAGPYMDTYFCLVTNDCPMFNHKFLFKSKNYARPR